MGTTEKQRFEWVDYSKGICIFAVVTLYSAGAATSLIGGAGWMQYWAEFAAPFRMPDFFLISGLFLARVIDRPWPHYLDKKVVHYSYFFLLWSAINLLGMYLVGDRSPKGVLVHYWSLISSWPFHMLWFIQMLAAYFFFAKITRAVPVWLMFPAACLLNMFPPFDTSRVLIDEFWVRYVFFYAGYVFSRHFFSLAAWVGSNPAKASGGLCLWALVNGALVYSDLANVPGIGLILGFAGAAAVVSVASLIKNFAFMAWVEYLGKNSIVVYLSFYWPMQAAGSLLAGISLFQDYAGLYTASITIAGLLGSSALFWTTNRLKIGQWLFNRPTWASIYRPRLATSPQSSS